jgi:hypothetical protein
MSGKCKSHRAILPPDEYSCGMDGPRMLFATPVAIVCIYLAWPLWIAWKRGEVRNAGRTLRPPEWEFWVAVASQSVCLLLVISFLVYVLFSAA